MKLNKILAISLLGLSCFGLVSCGNGDNSNNGGNGFSDSTKANYFDCYWSN